MEDAKASIASESRLTQPLAAGPVVDLSHYDGDSGHYYYPEVMGGGVALLNYDFGAVAISQIRIGGGFWPR